MPFVILIALGVILLLMWNLWKAIFHQDVNAGVYMHIVEGSAELRSWGTDDFFDLKNDIRIVQGDEVKSSSDARIIFEFFDGTIMRIDGGSDVIFEVVDDDEKNPEIKIILVDGSAWFNKVYKATSTTELTVTMNNVIVASDSAHIFEVENQFDEVVRVFNGEGLQVDVLTEEEKVVESAALGVGQEIVFTDKVLEAYWAFQSPTVISAVSDEFKQSEWYLWNLNEDQEPTEFAKVTGESGGSLVEAPPEVFEEEVEEGAEEDEDTNEEELEEPVEEEEEEVSGALAKPTITAVAGVSQPDSNGVYQTKSRVTTLAGTAPGASQVVVNGYTLQQFSAGDTEWNYFANADFGLLVPGENTYEIYSVDAEGNKSATLEVKVFYTAQGPIPVNTQEDPPEEDPVSEPGDEAANPVEEDLSDAATEGI